MVKGRISTTIPQREFENIKTEYEFDTEFSKEEAMENAINDCIRLNKIVGKTLKILIEDERIPEQEVIMGVTERRVVDQKQQRKRKGIWEEWNGKCWVVINEKDNDGTTSRD